MKKVVLGILFVSCISLLSAETQLDIDLKNAMENSEKFLKKVEKFNNSFDGENENDGYPLTSEGVAKAYCLAYSEVDFYKTLQFFEKSSKERARRELEESEKSSDFYAYKDAILSDGITCEIASIEKNGQGYKTYIFKHDGVDPINITKINGKFVIIDSEYIKTKKVNQNLVEKAEAYIEQDYKRLETVQASYPATSDQLAIASCEAIKNMDWDTLYRYSAPSFYSKLKVEIQDIEMKRDKYKKDFETFSCQIESSDYQKNLKVKYFFNGLGVIYVAFLPELDVEGGWKVIGF